ncbi:hypothetical protein V4F39_02310 [Aquincola sp. MAHUQ-54]|uniref:Uncharacterized protein n=1 Tax=Aquincola agrisoli TaxID=3119538 RepID=A0AAW9Q5G8_9BURK
MSHWFDPGRATARALFCGATLAALAPCVLAHDPAVLRSLRPGHPTGHLQRPGSAVWPPQPQGITDVIDHSDPGAEQRRSLGRSLAFSRVEQRFGEEPALRPLRERRLTPLAVVEVSDPARGIVTERRFQFFDRQANATVTVAEPIVGDTTVSTTPAAEYQPEITADEEREAIALARAFFLRRGDGRVGRLEGFAIQAYKPEGRGFYDGRVVYVSFHVDNDANPEYVAWVDLSAQRVIKSRKEPQ